MRSNNDIPKVEMQTWHVQLQTTRCDLEIKMKYRRTNDVYSTAVI